MSEEIREECGLYGVYGAGPDETAHMIYAGLYTLQHRGQESCGICVNNNREVRQYKAQGQVREVFNETILDDLKGGMGIGHVRYGVTSDNSNLNAQPLVTTYRKGPLAIAHNGNLANAAALREELEKEGALFQTATDSEIILHMITRERQILASGTIEQAALAVIKRLRGAFSVVMMNGDKIVAFRDPAGMRPLCIGKTADGAWVVASESCALDATGAKLERDVEPGELIVINAEGVSSHREHCGNSSHLCVFEFIYVARSDSVVDGQSVYEARREAGRILAREFPVEADLVIGAPDTGIDAARGYAEVSNIPLGRGIVVNRYVGRTFIIPGQRNRENAVRIKMNPISSEIAGKRIVLVEDSIVRGTTCENMVRLLKDAGATEVHFRVCSPPFLWPCYFGTDIPSREHLMACNYTAEEICKKINADSLGYMPLERLIGLAPDARCGFCDACFSGNYPVPLE